MRVTLITPHPNQKNSNVREGGAARKKAAEMAPPGHGVNPGPHQWPTRPGPAAQPGSWLANPSLSNEAWFVIQDLTNWEFRVFILK